MTIQVRRNEQANSVEFPGTTVGAYYNGTLTARANDDDANYIDIKNNALSSDSEEYFEFKRVLFSDFINPETDAGFASAAEAIEFINGKCNASVALSSSTFDPNQPINFVREATNTSILDDQGGEHGVNGIRAVLADDGTISIIHATSSTDVYTGLNYELVTISGASAGSTVQGVINNLNALFTVSPLSDGGEYAPNFPTLDGVATTNNLAEGIDPVGTPIYAVDGDTSGHGARLWTDETIDELGEFYTVKLTGKGRFILGLYSTNDGDLTELANNTGTPASGLKYGNAFYNYGSYIAPWTNYGSNTSFAYGPGWNGSQDNMMRYNTTVQDAFDNGDPVLFKVGIMNSGHLGIYYYDDGRSNDWILTARTNYVLPEDQYGLVVKLWDGSIKLYESPERTATDPAAPVLNYRYIESPDGTFHYPLFATAEEANWVDSENGGSGTSTGHVFVDEATGATWYAPATGYTNNGTAAPADTSEITWSSVPTLADELFAPTPFSDAAFTVNEGAAVVIQVAPQDAGFLTTISGDSAFSLDAGGHIIGTAPEVTGDNVTNPSDDYVIQVIRSNAYGSSTGEVTLTVNNLTAPVTPISGFNHVSGSTTLVDSNTMGDGSVVHVNNQVADGERFVIEKAYVEANILPALQASGDQYIIGLHNTGSDFTTLEIADFDAAIVWEYESATSHTFKFYRDGVVQQNIVVNSLTQAHYDYAIEADGTSAWLIACNVNSIMNEPSPSEGGSFTNTYEVTNTEDTAPLQIHLATLNTTGDFSATDISTVTVPAAPAGTTTPYNKALDFSGSNEHAKQVNNSYINMPLKMANASSTVSAPSAGQTVSSGHPWATAMVFRPDRHNSNQHIWNVGEGAGSTDDNIYVRLSSSGQLYFGWGRDGALNECFLQNVSTSWFGLYIGFNGTRLSGANATSNNLADCFDIHFVDLSSGTVHLDRSTASNWSSTGGRMDRQLTGDLTIGGRGSNRSFHGKVASAVFTTLKCGVAMPDSTEIEMLVRNPLRWVEDYREGSTFRQSHQTGNTTWNSATNYQRLAATQVWLMGDGTNDNYSNMIRNQIVPSDQNYTKLQLNSMVSNDIETVTISGLT